MTQATPRPIPTAQPAIFLTWLVLALNVLVFVAMLVAGVGVFSPSPASLIRWGADYGALTTGGEWWRLLTSMFLHIGLLHLVFNMFALFQIGPFIERVFGAVGFALVYLIAGLAGGIASLTSNPYLVSAGASGAIFGLYGALIGFLLVRRRALPSEVLVPLAKGAILFVGYNVVYGLTRPNIDIAAHFGGLAAGFVCGLVLSVPFAARRAVLAAAAAAMLVALAARLPHNIDLQAHIQQFGKLETETVAKFDSAQQRFLAGKIPAADFAAVLDKELTGWMTEHDTLAKLSGLPFPQSRIVRTLVRYMELRHDAWLAMAAGSRDGNVQKLEEAADKERLANQELKDLTVFFKTLESDR